MTPLQSRLMSIPTFGIQVIENGASTRIAPAGELDIATTPALERAIAEATAEPGRCSSSTCAS